MQKNSKLTKYFTQFSVITLILSIGIAPSLSFGFNPIGMTNLPINQVEMEFAINEISCLPGTVLMIGSTGQPGCAPTDSVEQLKKYGWVVISKGAIPKPLQASAMTDQSVKCDVNNIHANDQCILYNITGGTVIDTTINSNDNSLVIRINAEDAGVLTVTPHSSVQKGIFMVLVDGEEWGDAEIVGNNVIVMFPEGTKEIELFGTDVIEGVSRIPILTDQSRQCGPNNIFASGICIPYNISGDMVISATVNKNDNSLVIRINAEDAGVLTVSPATHHQKGIFMVLVDGEEWSDVEILGNTVTVMYPAGAKEIEIIGTFIVPEFGTVAAMILAVAIISIIAISAKSRLSIMPR